jgi:hypothetical protein
MVPKMFEYNIAHKILCYDMENIIKEMTNLCELETKFENSNHIQRNNILKYCGERKVILKKQLDSKKEALIALEKKYK